MKYIKVAIPRAVNPLTYKIPDELESLVQLGMRVVVPIRGESIIGLILEEEVVPSFDINKLKPIYEVIDDKPIIPSKLMALFGWVNNYYISEWHDILRNILPAEIIGSQRPKYRLAPKAPKDIILTSTETAIIEILRISKVLTAVSIAKRMNRRSSILPEIKSLIAKGFIANSAPPKDKEVRYQISSVVPENRTGYSKPRQKLLEILSEHRDGINKDKIKSFGITDSVIKSAIEAGLIEKFDIAVTGMADWVFDGLQESFNLKLTEEQQHAYEIVAAAMQSDIWQTFLLFGVTGSGKTEVYLQLIEQCLKLGKRAILLIPEIALASYLVQKVHNRFPGKVALLHSGLGHIERLAIWNSIREGEYPIMVGARSALFAPIENLGLLIVDEEHDTSYKQSEAPPCYHARDAAIMRAKLENCTILLGSATPSPESYLNAQTGKFQLLRLEKRVDNRPLPEVEIADLRKDTIPIGTRVLTELVTCLEKKEQAILLLNRRGYATYLQCTECGWLPKCPSCDISLTYHKHINQLVCHYCGYSVHVGNHCGTCGSVKIKQGQMGTEKIEAELVMMFPDVRILRLDADSTTRKGSHGQILKAFANHEADILVGTQMVAKGFDFPEVTLVGVINANLSLNLPDLRSAERTFILLTQVAGRSGRGKKPGKVIMQTLSPDHYAIICAAKHDVEAFYKNELDFRAQLNYPPFSRLARLLFSGEMEAQVAKTAQMYAIELHKFAPKDVTILGPAQPAFAKLKGDYRWHILLKAKTGLMLGKVIREAQSTLAKQLPESVRLLIDIDPISQM